MPTPLTMSSAAPPDAISASAGASNKKKKQKKKPKKPIDTNAKLDDGGQQPSPSPREEQTGDDEPDTPVVSMALQLARASTV